MGAGLHAAIHATLLPGFEIIRQLVDLDQLLSSGMDLVITAEGQMNHQSLNGKLPVELAKLAQSYGTKTIALVGSRDISMKEIMDIGFIGVYPIVSGPMPLNDAMLNGKALIRDTLINVLTTIHEVPKTSS